jgi:ADP-ribose pyrophosphatase YjhB (NUDIX family)
VLRSRLRPIDLPRVLVGTIVQTARLFSGRYGRSEGAHVLVTDADGRILVVRTTYLGRELLLPGGRVERHETPHQAAVRETREETGLEVRVTRLLLIDARRARDTSFVFAAELAGGELAPQLGEIAEAGFQDRAEIAAQAPRLDRLLRMIEGAEDCPAYIGL